MQSEAEVFNSIGRRYLYDVSYWRDVRGPSWRYTERHVRLEGTLCAPIPRPADLADPAPVPADPDDHVVVNRRRRVSAFLATLGCAPRCEPVHTVAPAKRVVYVPAIGETEAWLTRLAAARRKMTALTPVLSAVQRYYERQAVEDRFCGQRAVAGL